VIIEGFRTDRISKTKINCQEFRADTVKILLEVTEYALTAEE
jgi:hypothetical protein